MSNTGTSTFELQRFWNSTADWPLTPERDGVIFLTAAVHRIGRAVHGESWKGREPWMDRYRHFGMPGMVTTVGEMLPDGFDRLEIHHIAIARVLLEIDHNADLKPLGWEQLEAKAADALYRRNDLRPLSEGEWQDAIARKSAIYQSLTDAHRRWTEALEATFAFLKSGHLQTILRPARGGDYEEAPKGLWNTELRHVWARFAFCEVDLEHPFDQVSLRPSLDGLASARLIFVGLESADATVELIGRTLRPSPIPPS